MDSIKNQKYTPPIKLNIDQGQIDSSAQKQKTWFFKIGENEFDFKYQKILMNKQDLASFITQNLSKLPTPYWTKLAKQLEKYREAILGSIIEPEEVALFAAILQGVLGKISGNIKKNFDETLDGIAFYLENGELLLNGVNIHAFIEMSKKQKEFSTKTQVFLKGLKGRLAVLLSNRHGNPRYEKLRSVVEKLSFEIDEILNQNTPSVIFLPGPNFEAE